LPSFSHESTSRLTPFFIQGVAPFRAFVQDRVALARKAKEKDGPNALDSWGTIDLFYGCRRSTWDFLYKDEWDAYAAELGGKFKMHCAFSREEGKPKVYVQQLLRDEGERIGKALTEGKGYAYIWFVSFRFPLSYLDILPDVSCPPSSAY
jgi:NADPH-ferrihemoprotein reductase